MQNQRDVLNKSFAFFRPRLAILKFRPQPTNAFGAGARHPAQTRAEKFVLLVPFQTEATNFPVKLAEFPGGGWFTASPL